MCKRTFSSMVVVAVVAVLSQAAGLQGVMLEGRVCEGEVGDESKPIAGVTVDLYGSNNQAVKGTRIATQGVRILIDRFLLSLEKRRSTTSLWNQNVKPTRIYGPKKGDINLDAIALYRYHHDGSCGTVCSECSRHSRLRLL